MARRVRCSEDVSFVLTLWLEPSSEEAPQWRWRVRHVQSGEDRYFARIVDVLRFTAERAGVSPPEGYMDKE